MAIKIDYDQILHLSVNGAQAAGDVFLTRFRPPTTAPLEISYKGYADPVTDADLAADKAVAEVLKASGPPGNILSEQHDQSGYTWMIDPLCGTVPSSTGLAHFGVNIALVRGLQLQISNQPSTTPCIPAEKKTPTTA